MWGQDLNGDDAAAVTDGALAQGSSSELFVLVSVIGWRLVGLGSRQHAEQLPASRQVFLPVTIAEEAVVANALESAGQRMQEEAADELLGGKRHGLLLALAAVILILQTDPVAFDAQQTVVGDGDAMGIATDVIQHLFRAREGRLGIDDPLPLPERRQMTSKFAGIAEPLQSGEEL